MLKRIAIVVFPLLLAAGAYLFAAFHGHLGSLAPDGEVAATPRPAAALSAERGRQVEAGRVIGASTDKQILFGDLHVHSTFSIDAAFTALPVLRGEGAHPPADACDFARYCSALDFYSMNDHAEALTPARWDETRQTIERCNAVAGDPASPDMVAYLGWEWTQMENAPGAHYGHKNVVLRDIAPDRTPKRPIGALGTMYAVTRQTRTNRPILALAFADFLNRQSYFDFLALRGAATRMPACPDGVPVRELPPDCSEAVATPRELFDKLDEWGFPSFVIPHGNAWGNTTPALIDWAKQAGEQHDPDRQTLVEVYSGHGNSENYRSWRHVEEATDGSLRCPEPSEGFTPECHRAGEIIRARCLEAGEDEGTCEARAVTARANFVAAERAGPLTVPGEVAEDWLDSGQCTDCFQPAFQFRPGGSAQNALALGFRFGMIASSDNHQARAATGYKEFRAIGMTDTLDAEGTAAMRDLLPIDREVRAESRELRADDVPLVPGGDERLDSFFYSGGLVAVHAAGRDRGAIWDALERREVYGTSGPRILLWFELLNGPAGPVPMGGEAAMAETPRFRVRAVGSLEQQPGCPDYAVRGLSPERLEALCMGECHHPGDVRRPIARVEVVRIRTRRSPDEDVADLIEDPWRSFGCPGLPSGCLIEFEDPDYAEADRDTVYYVRALEAAKPLVNGDPLRCERDAEGNCIATRPCRAGGTGEDADECLSDAQPRAWSSPIFVDRRGPDT